MTRWREYYTRYGLLAGIIGSGLIAGVLFAFSCFVMQALNELPPRVAMAAMQHINVAIVNPLFALVFFGTAAVSAALAIYFGIYRTSPMARWSLIGALCYLPGVIGITVAFNIPLNDELAFHRATVEIASRVWPDYLSRWLLWNHIRALFAVFALGAYAQSLFRAGQASGESAGPKTWLRARCKSGFEEVITPKTPRY